MPASPSRSTTHSAHLTNPKPAANGSSQAAAAELLAAPLAALDAEADNEQEEPL
jgi:hypothetical protein